MLCFRSINFLYGKLIPVSIKILLFLLIAWFLDSSLILSNLLLFRIFSLSLSRSLLLYLLRSITLCFEFILKIFDANDDSLLIFALWIGEKLVRSALLNWVCCLAHKLRFPLNFRLKITFVLHILNIQFLQYVTLDLINY